MLSRRRHSLSGRRHMLSHRCWTRTPLPACCHRACRQPHSRDAALRKHA